MCVGKVTGLLFFGSWKLFSSFVASVVETNRVLIVIIILIAIDAKGAQALRAAGQPVVAGLVLFFKKTPYPLDKLLQQVY